PWNTALHPRRLRSAPTPHSAPARAPPPQIPAPTSPTHAFSYGLNTRGPTLLQQPGPLNFVHRRDSLSVMASAISHAVAALGIGACFSQPGYTGKMLLLGAFCGVAPDLDVIGFRFGIHYADFWGHRGFTHSFAFAAILATVALFVGFPRPTAGLNRLSVWSYFFLCAASHGFLDAMTDGGLGVAFFAPFNNQRYFLPWTPIHVSPIGITRFFSSRGLAVLRTEVLWVWLPAAMIAVGAYFSHRRTARSS